LREGNVEAAARTLEGAQKLLGSASEQESLMRARLLLAQHKPSMAWKVLNVLEQSALQEECDGSLVAINVLQALCKRALGQHSGAEPLTKTELDIVRLLNGGLTNQEIADKLAVTVGTTKWHMNQIFGKRQVRNRIEALARARQLKLL
jgi:ATP/maltotriose-dependent transcriptional regulator MalT